MKLNKYIIILGVLLLYSSCLTYYDTKSGMHKSVTIFDVSEGVVNAIKEPFPDRNTSFNRLDLNNVKEKQNKIHFEQHLENRLESYSGWWIYGDGAHFFKDENSLLEWSLEFPNEEEDQLIELYLAICEMEFFPMESTMKGVLKNDTLLVESFEIIYVQGCGE